MHIRSLSDKIVLYFVIIGIMAIGIVSTYSFHTSKNALLSRTFDQLTSVRVVKKGQLEQFFTDRLGEIELIADIAEIQCSSNPGTSCQWVNTTMLQVLTHLRSGNYYKGAYIQNEDGSLLYFDLQEHDSLSFEVLDQGDSGAAPEAFDRSGQSAKFSVLDYVADPADDRPRLFISGTIYLPSSAITKKILLELSLDAIHNIILEQNPKDGLGLSGESYLVGEDRFMRSKSRFQDHSIMQTQVNTRAVNDAFAGITGTSVIEDYRGIKVLSSYSKLEVEGLNWVILAEIDYAEATRSIYFIRNNILMLTIVVAVVVFIISMIFSKRITLPLIKLIDATANIRNGNLDVTLPRTKKDEIGKLTRSFNDMAQSLRHKDAELLSERNKRFTALIDGQELERQRLSRELHDGLGQSLIALRLKLESVHDKDLSLIKKTLKDIRNSFDKKINEVRRISNDLLPAVLIEFGLLTAVKNICEEISENSSLRIHLSSSGDFSKLDNRISTYVFRIIQETLNNVVKHAQATIVYVNLSCNDEFLVARISDNGIGMDPSPMMKNTGSGLTNIRERVRLLNGNIQIQSNPEKGTTISTEIPINLPIHEKN